MYVYKGGIVAQLEFTVYTSKMSPGLFPRVGYFYYDTFIIHNIYSYNIYQVYIFEVSIPSDKKK